MSPIAAHGGDAFDGRIIELASDVWGTVPHNLPLAMPERKVEKEPKKVIRNKATQQKHREGERPHRKEWH